MLGTWEKSIKNFKNKDLLQFTEMTSVNIKISSFHVKTLRSCGMNNSKKLLNR
jgi:hypothetical protein